MEIQRSVRCSENEEVALYLWKKRQEMAEQPKGISDKLEGTLAVAYRNICDAKAPIKNIKDLSSVKGVGKWVLRLMKGVFQNDQGQEPTGNVAVKGKKTRGPKRYMPQKNSVAHALLITLYRGIAKGNDFMRKQQLIDEAEASGLSLTSIGREKGQGKPGQFGSFKSYWYTGWSCMKNLIDKGLVVKSSCPAKYMLTEEGKEAARECLRRSDLVSSVEVLLPAGASKSSYQEQNASTSKPSQAASFEQELSLRSADKGLGKECINITSNTDMRNVTINHVRTSTSDSDTTEHCAGSACISSGSEYSDTFRNSSILQTCTTFIASEFEKRTNALAMPPRTDGMRFDDIYDVILVLDDRENFGSRLGKVSDAICSQFKVSVEVRRLSVGDGIWIARHKQTGMEYVLDFIVERKRIDDLCASIRDNRYKDQKLRLVRCGLRKLIYLVEGDPNLSNAAESIKTACPCKFTLYPGDNITRLVSQQKYLKVLMCRGPMALQIL